MWRHDQAIGIRDARDSLEERHGSISTALNIYTHVVDASHRAAVTAFEDRLFGVMLRNAPKTADALENGSPVSDSVK
jgi:hypothetical protein